MCIQRYVSFIHCPCQLKWGDVDLCDPHSEQRCRFVQHIVYTQDSMYCRYHERMNVLAKRSRRAFFARRWARPRAFPKDAPVLGRRLGGDALRTAFAGSAGDFPAEAVKCVDDSSDDEGMAPEDEKPWDFRNAGDVAELHARVDEFHASVAAGRMYYWLPARPVWLRPNLLTQSFTWIAWVWQRKDLAGMERPRLEESGSSSIKESSQVESSSALEKNAEKLEAKKEEKALLEEQSSPVPSPVPEQSTALNDLTDHNSRDEGGET
ncbi:hypothetical protein F4804DRAFT_24784 [Jackrogersella minutella]|nr:hypothetical protein F4804DRAFT_24784 [Jackrogersella minutella]